ncbi:HtaA domain-containing protein [Leucobacter sp. HY1910]
MSARSRLARLGSAALKSALIAALIASGALLAAPAAHAVGDAPGTVQAAETAQPQVDASLAPDQAVPSTAPETPTEHTQAPPEAQATESPAPEAPAPETFEDLAGAGEHAAQEERDQAGPAAPAQETAQSAAQARATEPSAAQSEVQVAAGSLTWGVKSSFRNYIYNFAAFEGRSELLGGAVAQPTAKGEFVWSAGTGTAAGAGDLADIAFREGSGVHFQSHPMQVNGSTEYALDLAFTAPRVVVTSPTTGELRLDVSGRDYVSPTEVGSPFTFTDVVFATLDLPQPHVDGDRLTWSSAQATLTQAGSDAFGGFYQAGESLDPLTFSTTGREDTATPGPSPVATSLDLTASSPSIEVGAKVTFTATVTPEDAAGRVQFFTGATTLGNAQVSGGTATLATAQLAAGTHEISAEFMPANAQAYTPATSTKTTQVRVTEKPAGPVTGPVSKATLSWGIKESFRRYITGTIAHGSISTLGSTTQASKNGVFTWTGGTGTATSDGSKANVSYGEGNGAYLRGHEMNVEGKTAYALDLAFTNPRVVVKSATVGELRMDVSGREFAGMTSVGDEIDLKQVTVATLDLPAPAATGKTLSWTNVPATLTKAGSSALGEFYGAGEALDPVSFSLPMSEAVTGKTPTATTLRASATSVNSGAAVTLTAAVKPNLKGTVEFVSGGKRLGGAVQTPNGQATTTVKLADGAHSVIATFTPDSADYGHSVSSAVKITVNKRTPDVAPPASNGSQAAGSLVWGVSTAFANYVTGPIAKGEVTTSGVGSSGGAYLFPQATGGSWDAATHTGSVQYTGSVTYTGHHGLLREGVTNPMIRVTGPTSAVLYSGGAQWATLDLGAASKSVGAGGEVTWSGVPVSGGFSGGADGGNSYSLPADGLTFTVGAASGASYGSTSVSNASKKRTVAAAAPTTAGIRIITPAAKITAGAELEFAADGFEPGEREMIVALYPGVTVLDEAAGANDAGTVNWLGNLPEDLKPGEYTITVQGSTDAGAVFTVLDADEVKAEKKKQQAAAQAKLAQGVQSDAVSSAGIGPAGSGPEWLWWVGAGALLIIAAAMGGLVALQRRGGQ